MDLEPYDDWYEDLEWLESKMDRGTITLEEYHEMENLRALWYQEKDKNEKSSG